MNFNYSGVRYWGNNFKKFNHFDIIPYKDVVEAYIKTSNELKPDHEKFGWNERPINSDVDTIKKVLHADLQTLLSTSFAANRRILK